jgi:hypothetical protein
MAERRELRAYVISALVSDLCSLSLYTLSDGTLGIVGDASSKKSEEDTLRQKNSASKFRTAIYYVDN